MKTAIGLIFICSVFTLISVRGAYQKVDFDFRKLVVDKEKGNVHTVRAPSLSRCLELCDLYDELCDGVLFFESVQKCRLVEKCKIHFIKYITEEAEGVYYSKRPMTNAFAYEHNPKTDGCIGLVDYGVNYKDAVRVCERANGRLLKINDDKVNKIAKNLLVERDMQWAWIHMDSVIKANFSLDMSASFSNSLLKKNFIPCFVPQRHDPFSRHCFAINGKGQWGKFSCVGQLLYAICEIPNKKHH